MTVAPLTSDRVFESAVALADEVGMEGFTIRRLATALGVKPMTLYHHVSNKEAIIDGMVELVFSEMQLPPADTDWMDATRHRARSAREVLARHPWAPPLMESRESPGPETLRHHDAVIRCFRQAGFSVEKTAHAIALVDSYIYGFALHEANLPATRGDSVADIADTITRSFEPGLYPHLAEFVTEHVLKPEYDFGAEFEFGLNVLLDGLDEAADDEVRE